MLLYSSSKSKGDKVETLTTSIVLQTHGKTVIAYSFFFLFLHGFFFFWS